MGEGEGGKIWENGIETCIIYMKQITSLGSMQDTGCLGLVHWDDPEGGEGRMALKHVYHIRNESPVQVRCRIQEAWDWCTGMTQRDRMGREVGGRFRMGNTCTPVADAC